MKPVPKLIGTCPPASRSGADYLKEVAEVARWADDDGWEALLVYTDHRMADPWLVSQLVLQATKTLRPLLALQPIYAHPFTIAKSISSFAYLYGRQVYLNMVAGGFPQDLEALCDTTPHDQRYDRLVEYAKIIQSLLTNPALTSFDGHFYKVKNLRLPVPFPKDLVPAFTVSGSSPAGLAAARTLGARAIQYLRPSQDYAGATFDPTLSYGTRLGIIVRDDGAEAWRVAHARFPDAPELRAIRKYAASISDSVWVKELEREVTVPAGHPYWLGPYRTAKGNSPFLVGDAKTVARELASYMKLGIGTFLLEPPVDAADSKRITQVFRDASALDPPAVG